MDYTPKRSRKTEPQINPLFEAYPHDLQLYKTPPKGQISLVEFQDLALERQKVLQLLEATITQQHKSFEEAKAAFASVLRKEGYIHYCRLVNAQGCASHTEQDLEARRRDHISHYVMRLAYSLKEDLQKYMITQETELFKMRFSSLNKEGRARFLTTSDVHYTQVTPEFKEENRENFYASASREGFDFENTDFYELPFDEVVDLIADRRVYLHKGIAYVPQSDLITVFCAHFRTNLAIELNRAKKFVMNNLDDERLQIFLKSLPECFSGMGKVIWNSEHTPIAKLDDLSKTSFPLCMRVMHEQLTTKHHLRNVGRLQYGLFLKGIGVTMDDSIEFWRNELTKNENITEDKFNKEYLYQIKYNYGKMGRRVDYRPAGCNKLITESVGSGEVHGCPYKHMDTDELTRRLNEIKILPADVVEITRLASEGHYILACTKYFESTHRQLPARMFMHPNQYFSESRLILTKDETTKDEENVNQTVQSTQDSYMPLSPERTPQPLRVKVENNRDSSHTVTPSRTIEKKVRPIDKKTDLMDPVNIAALLEDDSD